MNGRSLLAAWARQQKELGMPDLVLSQEIELASLSGPAEAALRPTSATAPQPSNDPFQKLSRLKPVMHSRKTAFPEVSGDSSVMTNNPLSREQKRSIFKELYTARCDNCHLAKSRTKFVFGAGNVDAPLLIIGEAPGAEEDREGLPFVGAAGKLLTTLFTGAGLERDKDTFITNVLKCRPPKNRNPESGEIAACLPLLEKQVRVIGPKIILLLGKIAAHAVLDLTDSILKMRRSMNEYRGIPVIVTYHPAAILRNPEYRAPAEEDFVKVARFLKKENHGAAH